MTPAPSNANCIDLIFHCNGSSLRRDHGYSLYGAISRIVPAVHQSKNIGIFPIRGSAAGNGTLLLNDHSTLRLRLPADQLPAVLPLVALQFKGGVRYRSPFGIKERSVNLAHIRNTQVLNTLRHQK